MMGITSKETTTVIDKQKRNATQNRYNRETTTALSIKLNNRTDADILEYLTSVPNKQGLIKNLLRKYMTDHPLTKAADMTDHPLTQTADMTDHPLTQAADNLTEED